MPLRSRNCRLQGPPSIISEIFKKITNRPCKFAKNAYLCIPENEGGRFFRRSGLPPRKNLQKRFAESEKVTTFAIPNESAGRQEPPDGVVAEEEDH